MLSSTTLAAPINHPRALSVTPIESIPHAQQSFTQGLVLFQNDFIESSGHYKKSFISRHSPSGDKPQWKLALPSQIFAEGLTIFHEKIYLLSWKSKTLFVFDVHTQALLRTHNYKGEGWGLTHNGQALIRSDGSNKLYFHDPKTFRLLRSIKVTINGQYVSNINELEYARGLIWANVWKDNRIIAIDPTSGIVQASADLSTLAQQQQVTSAEAVLNGIAYDPQKDAFWVTGKYWPALYLLTFQDL